ncbi:MAG: TlpA disulfide reductase family protein [Nonlabens sp.]
MRLLLLLSLLLIISCNNIEKPINPEEASNPSMEKKISLSSINTVNTLPEVTLMVKDSSINVFTNAFYNDVQDMPDILQVGAKHGRMSVTVPTQYGLLIRGGNPMNGYGYKYNFKNGDTVILDELPVKINGDVVNFLVADVTNREVNWNELNIDYLQYSYKSEERAPQNFIAKDDPEPLAKPLENRSKKLTVIDKLLNENKISPKFHISEQDRYELEYYTTAFRLGQTRGIDLDASNLPFGLNQESRLDNNYYRHFLVNAHRYHYDLEWRKPFEEMQHLFERDTLFNQNTKSFIARDLLKLAFGIQKSKIEAAEELFIQNNAVAELDDFWKIQYPDPVEEYDVSNEGITLLQDPEGKEIKYSLLKSNLEGKVVLIDFWASWCMPCIAAFPQVKKLEKEINHPDFAILRLSIDTDARSWKRASTIEKLNDNNYLVKNWKSSNLNELYAIESIPRYMLMDRTGAIVHDNAPFPKDPELEILIKGLLSVTN